MKSIGICFGASTLQVVIVEKHDDDINIIFSGRKTHDGNPRKALLQWFTQIDLGAITHAAVTGRALRQSVLLPTISESIAVESAIRFAFAKNVLPDFLISLGGETQIAYQIGNKGTIQSVHSGNKCAAGTGEFFVQQVRRMNLSVDEAVALAGQSQPHKIAGRCSVFCKSDCTHALNKGEEIGSICAGLCVMMADKVSDLVKQRECHRIGIIGGGSLNTALVELLRARFDELQLPPFASTFEALGAALFALDQHAINHALNGESLFAPLKTSFTFHRPLRDARDLVTFASRPRVDIDLQDEYALGLDVGSTTTKAVLIRLSDGSCAASVYLRTSGDPVWAARECYADLRRQCGESQPKISSLGVTGSGRRVAALHALTDVVIDEISAHAIAAAFFDPEVDTIFEIGGQDAKYTRLTSGVPSDYAMNEACSAGTGSFLEEAVRESLRMETREIADAALRGMKPPDFSDQCSAFISTDIKRAIQEGIDANDIAAGLLYAVCVNYLNKVKGSRSVGKKIFMQGGVCNNRALPLAMAGLMQTPIIVPSDPGLMGALGVALDARSRLGDGRSTPVVIDLEQLRDRQAQHVDTFICAGGAEKCDRRCRINRIRIDGTLYPFGGACNRYYIIKRREPVDVAAFDFVAIRQKLLFEKYSTFEPVAGKNTEMSLSIGLNRSFLTYSLLPLYSHFFSRLGCKVIVADEIDPAGMRRTESSFCFPVELAHGGFLQLLKQKVDVIFLPQVMQVPVNNVPTFSRLCVFAQGEPYYLKTTFRTEIEASSSIIVSPVLKLEKGYESASDQFVQCAVDLGFDPTLASEAYRGACEYQRGFERELRDIGSRAMQWLDEHPEKIGIVLFGRPYNAFASEANMAIPHKVASRGYCVIPHDMLIADDYPVDQTMFWAMGQKMLKAAQYVKEHDSLFGVFITNFSCGPDSFLLGYFRNIMAQKPSLTLELDQHTADAGVDTRIEAAIEIMKNFYRIKKSAKKSVAVPFVPARIEYGKQPIVFSSTGESYSLTDPHVEVLLPSMGRRGAQAAAAVLSSKGINARALPVADHQTLCAAKKHCSGKECLPYMVTTGSFLQHIEKRKDPNRVSLFFLATGGGPCRLGQYAPALTRLISDNQIPNAAVFAMTDENGYSGLGARTLLRAWQAFVIADLFGDIENTLQVCAADTKHAHIECEACWKDIVDYFTGKLSVRLTSILSMISQRLGAIELKRSPAHTPVVSLVGEIFVRRDEFSRQNIVQFLASHGFITRIAPTSEYLCYSSFVVNNGLGEKEFSRSEQFKLKMTSQIQEWWERRIKAILGKSGLIHNEMIDVTKTITKVDYLLNPNFRGECILTVGLAMREMLHDSCGIISIGPFGCMYSRMAEAMLKKELTVDGMRRYGEESVLLDQLDATESLPFLSIESDGTPFGQLVEANLEAFVLRAKRLDGQMREAKRVDKQIWNIGRIISETKLMIRKIAG